MATCNPFKVGDKVKLLKSSYDFNPALWRKYDGYRYSIVTGLFDGQISTTEDSRPQHYTHFELYEEEKDMTPQTTPQTQPKTKRVPFTHELWEKWKDKGVMVTTLNGKVLEQFTHFNLPDIRIYAGVYGGLIGNYYSHHLFLEIPITTKRIPFNPELKDAKVFLKYNNVPVDEWHWFSNNIVAVLTTGKRIDAKFPPELEMEIEENV